MEDPAFGVSPKSRRRLLTDTWELTQQVSSPTTSSDPSRLASHAPRDLELDHAWALLRALSPRTVVRVASLVDRDGTILNEYDREWSVTAPAPSTPWAMYLSGDRENYDYLVFDLDSGHGNAVRDADRLSLWLDELRISHLVAESGPTGGRHIWIRLDASIPAAEIKELSRLAKQLLPSLDVRPLQNAKTGCVRPPGSPHRFEGSSRPLGPLSTLTDRGANAGDVAALRAFLLDLGAEVPTPTPTVARGLALTATAQPYVEGSRRELSPAIADLLTRPVGFGEDASLRLATVLAGMANAHWQLVNVDALVNTAPAFEHVRTVRQRDRRVPRSAARARDVLERAWRHACEFVATHPAPRAHTTLDDNGGYIGRLTTAVQAVEALQDRADVMPGLWGADRASNAARARRGTYSRRAVLDALCLLMVQAASTTIEADCRRLARHTGYGKTTTADALRDLATPLVDGDAESAWIVRVGEPERGKAQRYRLSKRFSTENQDPTRTKDFHAPPPVLPLRDQLLTKLGARLQVLALDVFAAPYSLGRHAGNVYRHLPETLVDGGTTVAALVHCTGLSPAHVRIELDKLTRTGMAIALDRAWTRGPANPRAIAIHLDVDGYLDDRARRYTYESERWHQWLGERIININDHVGRRRRPTRPDATAYPLWHDDHIHDRAPRYPKRPDGTDDHPTALRLIAARHAA